MSVVIAKPEHEVCYQDLAALIGRHAGKMTAEQILAVAANMLGKLIALQDQRTMTRDRALEIVLKNIELGNEQVVKQLAQAPAGGTA
jgi:outer membrane lipoprotein SlyB